MNSSTASSYCKSFSGSSIPMYSPLFSSFIIQFAFTSSYPVSILSSPISRTYALSAKFRASANSL